MNWQIRQPGPKKIRKTIEFYPLQEYINVHHSLFGRPGNSTCFSFRKKTFESEESNVLKEIETFIFDENLLKAEWSKTSCQ